MKFFILLVPILAVNYLLVPLKSDIFCALAQSASGEGSDESPKVTSEMHAEVIG